ncbi:hypothetical protein GQX74_008508 [Glossina fuscipes]|nr:hypothetical protein GQX74_008508 [Glossina fuscipes]
MPPPAQSLPLTSKEEHASSRRYCSTALFEAIRIICGGRYNSLGKRYRGHTSTLWLLTERSKNIFVVKSNSALSEISFGQLGHCFEISRFLFLQVRREANSTILSKC